MIEPHTFELPGATWRIVFSIDVLRALDSHRQLGKRDREAVGQLFSPDLTRDEIVIDGATVLPPVNATCYGVVFSPEAARRERERYFAQGRHCVGIWHSHPEHAPSPSGIDLHLAADHARAARANLTGLVFVIVGKASFPDGLFVGVHDGEQLHRARLI
ncbi:Mov34/MPN/PAD-1 family protein [Cupriavidus pauculus]|uniref:JAB domain-containing protein n=1 Tax=Cupriavidus pauculus TaxID=82633 RepID=A0A2N5C347_9BURK|nr:Mov34/MPN/PAD-1 family protein [Cupriavidus pauculus]PLP96635.1 hypothetical protein CYJ10_30940 [Cupriavidus pauculus]